MRATMVEGVPPSIEALLLTQAVGLGRTASVGGQGAMHAFVAAVLLRMAWDDTLQTNAQRHEPGR
jgi:hypothetical protein